MVSTNRIFSGFAFIGFVLVSVLLPLHVKARNIGTCALIIWIGLLCFNGFVNSIIWDHNFTDWAPVWCDISSRLVIGGRIGVQLACLCIARHLYLVTRNINTSQLSQVRPWRAIVCDFLLVIGVPTLFMVISYIVQVLRFVIYEEIGCYFALDNTQPSYPLRLIWPFLVSLNVVVYLGVTIRTLIQRRAGFTKLIQHDEHFFQLLTLAVVIVTCTFPYSLWVIVADATGTGNPVSPWSGWDNLHGDIPHVVKVPAVEWQATIPVQVAALQFERWVHVMYAIMAFSFFGFTTEAKKSYRAVLGFLTSSFGTLAIYIGRSKDRPILAYARQAPGYLLFPHTASAVESLQRTSRNSSSLELSDHGV